MIYGQEYIASSQYWTIPPAKMQRIIDNLGAWLDSRTDAQLEVYSSFPIALNPDTLCLGFSNGDGDILSNEIVGRCATENKSTYRLGCPQDCDVVGPDPRNAAHACIFHENIEPWMSLRQNRLKRYWLDSAASNGGLNTTFFPDFLQFAHSPIYRNPSTPGYPNIPHLLGMEAIPTLPPNYNQIDLPRAELAPAIAFTEFLFDRNQNKTWNVSQQANTTELVAVLSYSEDWVFENSNGDDVGVFAILDWARRGFVLYVANPEEAGAAKLVEYVKRVYDMGILSSRRDFNGDGTVNGKDLADFNAQWNLYNGKTTGCNWIHGDIDQDNDVDQIDKNKFTMWQTPFPSGGQPPAVPVNLGAAEPDDVFTMPN